MMQDESRLPFRCTMATVFLGLTVGLLLSIENLKRVGLVVACKFEEDS
jgi:hypothetical protein